MHFKRFILRFRSIPSLLKNIIFSAASFVELFKITRVFPHENKILLFLLFYDKILLFYRK